jgi:teichuronic acid biosynthesis glycosyltransferase TuaG
MKSPLVSIIIPVYNTSQFILETLESVKKQTYTNWEIILVNDCSTDNTLEIVTNFSNGITNSINCVSNSKNSGASYSRNYGVAHASGDWLALLDGDDVWLPNHLETLIDIVSKDSKIRIAYSGCFVFKNHIGNIIFKQEITEFMLRSFNVSLYTHQIGINPCTVLIDIKTWKSIGGLDLKLKNAEDKDFFLSAAKLGARFSYTGIHTALYRKHENAKSNNAAKMALAAIYIYEKHFDWEAIPLKIRINQLAGAHLSYARLIKQVDVKLAVQHSLKALKIKKNIKNTCYFLSFTLLSLFTK